MAKKKMPQVRAIVTRAKAKAKGLKRYFTGKRCKRGHLAERQTVNGHCISCRDADVASFCKSHRERRNRERRERNAANPEKRRRQRQLHRLLNIEEYREHDRLVSQRHRDKKLQRALKWQRDNPEKMKVRGSLRRARKLFAPGHYDANDVVRLIRWQKGMCFYCLRAISNNYHVDHFYPLTRGGSNWPDNLRIACVSCNARKHNRDPIEFMQNDTVCLNARKLHIKRRHSRVLEHECPR